MIAEAFQNNQESSGESKLIIYMKICPIDTSTSKSKTFPVQERSLPKYCVCLVNTVRIIERASFYMQLIVKTRVFAQLTCCAS